jgi:hypothetical protein
MPLLQTGLQHQAVLAVLVFLIQPIMLFLMLLQALHQ